MGFRLKQKSMTLNDHERQFTALSSVFSLLLKVTENLTGIAQLTQKDRAIYSVFFLKTRVIHIVVRFVTIMAEFTIYNVSTKTTPLSVMA